MRRTFVFRQKRAGPPDQIAANVVIPDKQRYTDPVSWAALIPDHLRAADAAMFTPALPDRQRYADAVASVAAGGVWADKQRLTDPVSWLPALPDKQRYTDTGSFLPALPDKQRYTDAVAYQWQSIPDKQRYTDLSSWAVSNIAYPRSGTPDSDPGGDAWTDAATLPTNQTGVNHGNEDLQVVNLATGAKIGWLEADFTKYAGVTASAGGSLTLWASSALVAGIVLTFGFATKASRPFTESTITQANQPAHSSLFTKTATLTTSLASYVLPFTNSDLNLLLGSWVQIQVTSNSGVNTSTIVSRDNATVAHRPTWALNLQR